MSETVLHGDAPMSRNQQESFQESAHAAAVAAALGARSLLGAVAEDAEIGSQDRVGSGSA